MTRYHYPLCKVALKIVPLEKLAHAQQSISADIGIVMLYLTEQLLEGEISLVGQVSVSVA